MTNQYKRFQGLLPSQRRAYVTVVQVRADGTSIVQTPEARTFRARGGGVPAGSNAFVKLVSGQPPEMDGAAPSLPLSQFVNL